MTSATACVSHAEGCWLSNRTTYLDRSQSSLVMFVTVPRAPLRGVSAHVVPLISQVLKSMFCLIGSCTDIMVNVMGAGDASYILSLGQRLSLTQTLLYHALY